MNINWNKYSPEIKQSSARRMLDTVLDIMNRYDAPLNQLKPTSRKYKLLISERNKIVNPILEEISNLWMQ